MTGHVINVWALLTTEIPGVAGKEHGEKEKLLVYHPDSSTGNKTCFQEQCIELNEVILLLKILQGAFQSNNPNSKNNEIKWERGETRKGKGNVWLSGCSFVWPVGHACWQLFLVVREICMEVWVDQMALLCLSFRNWYLQRDPSWKDCESKAGGVFYKLETLPNIFQRWLWFLPLIIVCSQSRVVFQIFNN